MWKFFPKGGEMPFVLITPATWIADAIVGDWGLFLNHRVTSLGIEKSKIKRVYSIYLQLILWQINVALKPSLFQDSGNLTESYLNQCVYLYYIFVEKKF